MPPPLASVPPPTASRLRRWRGLAPVPAASAAGQAARLWVIEPPPSTYWSATRRPFVSLVFVAPLAIAYETAVFWQGGLVAAGPRTGADAWMCRALAAIGLSHPWFLPLLLAAVLMAWQLVSGHDWRLSPAILAGMALESLACAAALLGVGRLIDLGFSQLEHAPWLTTILATASARTTATASSPAPNGLGPLAPFIGFLGAGIYEETLFRLLLVPLFYRTLRVLQMPQVFSSSTAVTAAALLFALAHHAGNSGEMFTWYAFVFRWMAGVFFGWVFILRGFGIAVGTHAAYDVLATWMG